MKELGYDVEFSLWVGLFAPKGTPAERHHVLRARTSTRPRTPSSSRRRSTNLGEDVAYLDQPEFAKFWDEDAKRVEDGGQGHRQGARLERAQSDSRAICRED